MLIFLSISPSNLVYEVIVRSVLGRGRPAPAPWVLGFYYPILRAAVETEPVLTFTFTLQMQILLTQNTKNWCSQDGAAIDVELQLFIKFIIWISVSHFNCLVALIILNSVFDDCCDYLQCNRIISRFRGPPTMPGLILVWLSLFLIPQLRIQRGYRNQIFCIESVLDVFCDYLQCNTE